MRLLGGCLLPEALQEAQQSPSSSAQKVYWFSRKGPLPPSVQELPLKSVLGSQLWVNHFVPLSVLSLWWAVSTRVGRHQVALEELAMWFSITCCTGSRTGKRWAMNWSGGCKGPGQPVPSPQGMSRAPQPLGLDGGPISSSRRPDPCQRIARKTEALGTSISLGL